MKLSATRTRTWVSCILLLTLLFGLSHKVWAPSLSFSGGVSIYKSNKVFPGVVVFTPPKGFTVAVNHSGVLVHAWIPPQDHRIQYSKPLPGPGREVLSRIIDENGVRRIAALNAYSYPLWEFEEPQGVLFHHDHQLLENGNVLILCSRTLDRPALSDQPLIDDCLMEVDIAGNIVWEWQTADHFADFAFTQEEKDKIFAVGGDWAHANSASEIPLDTSHADPDFRAGNIIISYRHLNSIAIVDRSTHQIVWRTKNLTIGQHDAKMLPNSLSGAGHILVFDNGQGGDYGDETLSRNFSRVVEIDPVSTSIAGQYTAGDSGLANYYFWSSFVSGAERLPNGNILICEGAYGRIFEVTQSGEIVWEFVNPIFGNSPFNGTTFNLVYRAHKVPQSDW